MKQSRMEHREYTFEIRAAEESDKDLVLRGYAAVFDQETDIGGYFREVIRPGAFAKTIRDGKGIKAVRNHNTDFVLASLSGRTMELTEDDKGLAVELHLDPENTESRNTYLGIKRGDIDKMSFAFNTIKEQWTSEEGETDLRELLELRLWEVSPVTFPAYDGTSIEAEARAILVARDEAGAAQLAATTSTAEDETTSEPEPDGHHSEAELPKTRMLRRKLELKHKEMAV